MKTYDPSEVSVVIGGVIVKSWNEVTVAMEEDRNVLDTGTTGETTRTKNANRLGTIVIDMPQTSEDNLKLSGLLALDVPVPCAVIDSGGFSLHVMPQGVIMKSPDSGYGKENGTREWTITGDIPDPQVVGGN